MSFGLTLYRYLGLRFLSAVLIVFVTVFLLVAIVDFVELLRRAGDVPMCRLVLGFAHFVPDTGFDRANLPFCRVVWRYGVFFISLP